MSEDYVFAKIVIWRNLTQTNMPWMLKFIYPPKHVEWNTFDNRAGAMSTQMFSINSIAFEWLAYFSRYALMYLNLMSIIRISIPEDKVINLKVFNRQLNKLKF